MTERENVIGLLKETAEYFRECRSNASFASKAENHFWELQNAANEVVELLKEQEAVKPIMEQDSMVCGVCGHDVIWQKMLGDGILADEKLDYCPHCGRKVKWDE